MRSLLPVCLLLLSACTSTHYVNLEYGAENLESSAQAKSAFVVGSIEDDRREQSNIIGTIRGGYGNPLKRIHLEGSVTDQVREFVSDALATRGLLADPGSSTPAPLLNVRLNRLDSSYLVRKEAHASITIAVTSAGKEQTYLEETYVADLTRGGVGAGVFGNAEALGELANQALVDAINKAMGDPELLSAGVSAAAYVPEPTGLTARLKELDKLLRDGVITREEYDEARRAALNSP